MTVRIRGLRLGAPRGRTAPRDPLLQVDHLEIHPCEYIALVGPNGAGKSLLLHLLAGLATPSVGSIEFDFADGSVPRVGLVFQAPDDQIVGSTVERDLAFGLENRALPPAEIRREVDGALARFDLAPLAQRPPHRLSDGEKQRLALAAALVLAPHLLLLDEPTARLDPPSRRALLDELPPIVRAGATVLHVTHRSEEIVRAGRVVGLGDGRVTFDGTPAALLAHPGADALGVRWSGPHQLRRELARRGRAAPPPPDGDWNAIEPLVDALAGGTA